MKRGEKNMKKYEKWYKMKRSKEMRNRTKEMNQDELR